MALASSVHIEINGQKVTDFLDISIDQKMIGIQEFHVSFRMDTFEAPDDFVMNQSKKFIGSNMIISIDAYGAGGIGSNPGLFFKGIVHSIRAVKSDLSHEDLLVLSGFSPDILLFDHSGCRSFENKTLKQIVEEVLKPYPRDILKSKVDPAYKEQIPYCVQYNENRLDFLHRLAARYGEWMYYNGSELIFGASKSNKEELMLGKDINTFDFSLNLKAPAFKYVSYDYINAKRIETSTDNTSGKQQQNEVGKYTYDQSVKRFTQPAIVDYPHLNVSPDSYNKEQKNAVELESSAIALAMTGIEGSGENMNLMPGSKITVKATKTESKGEVDYGEYLVTSVIHRCNNLFDYENAFTAIPGEAKIPPYTNPEAIVSSEPQSALVKDNNDPEKLGRIRVKFFWQESNSMSPWIRLVTPYSGTERGFYFIPEIGDEVLVGFEGGDAEKPYVLGSLYHGKNKPHNAWPNTKNNFKGIVTKSNLRIEFDDEKKITTIDTPGGNKIVVSDNEKSIVLKDQNMNKVELSPDGIVLDSLKDIKLSSKSKITIDATSGVDIKSVADVKISGLNINHSANVSFTAKGNASAELSASGQTTVKGTIVMIN